MQRRCRRSSGYCEGTVAITMLLSVYFGWPFLMAILMARIVFLSSKSRSSMICRSLRWRRSESSPKKSCLIDFYLGLVDADLAGSGAAVSALYKKTRRLEIDAYQPHQGSFPVWF